MTLSPGQRRHLISAYATISHLLQQMEEAATEGRSPTGVGAPLTPLPRAETEAICGPLRELRQILHAYAESLAPEELAAFERPQPLANTRVWLSNLLEKIRYAVDSLQPRQMKRYGPENAATKTAFAELHEALTRYIQQAREALEGQE